MAQTSQTVENLDAETKQILGKVANTIRQLSMDAVQQANSGHPGLPLGCAELGAYLYGYALKHNPKNSKWAGRDRMILSAGHGSMWLYSCLHLSGFDLSLEEIKNFRQLHSQTPGHPEAFETDGVETTTGPLGQGFGNAVGQALGLKLLGARFNTPDASIFDGKVYCLAGDGCIMEGVTSEVSSLAGHLKLDNLIVIYDANHVSLDGPLAECCSEDTMMRYRAYGWDVQEIDGNDLDAVHQAVTIARTDQKRPCLIVAHTIIGKGSPNKAGTYKVHGSPLGEEEVKLTKEALGLPQDKFYIPQAVKNFFTQKLQKDASLENQWKERFASWQKANPELAKTYDAMANHEVPEDIESFLKGVEVASPIAGRSASNIVLNALAGKLPQIIGGSADLSCSDLTMIKGGGLVAPGIFTGRNIKYGVREFGMATMATGLNQTNMILPFIGTFLTFSDYMRNAIRLASLQHTHVVYQFTHDSIFLGEDGPTHQPVEHFAALRAIPNLHVIRPADANEVKGSWIAALRYIGPTAIILSRQNLPTLPATDVAYAEGVGRGAYIIKRETRNPDFTLLATGSEVSLAMDVAQELEKLGKAVRVVSMPCWELFEQQNQDYKNSVLGGDIGRRVSIEAGVEMGWHKYIGMDGVAICMEGFGLSAPAGALAKEFGFTVESILERIL
ncbi:MAG: transketolase [Chlamydiales bacterium]|nr:transketolase [Chlamydiales bacterium]